MEIKEVTGKQEWEDFLLQCKEKTFLQSWNWGEFQQSLGNKIWRYGIYENEILISAALVVTHKARRASFLLVPHGPVTKLKVESEKLKVIEVLLKKLKELAVTQKADFIRISPIWERLPENEKVFKDLKFRLRPLHTHPESSWKLNINPTEEELLDGMRKTTRYLIKQAQKNKDIEIYQSKNIEDVEIFNKMHLEVVKQQKFVPFSLEYFKKEFNAFLPDDQIGLFLAKYKGKVIAASYGIFWPARQSLLPVRDLPARSTQAGRTQTGGAGGSGMAFYHHAALLPEYKKIPVSYLLQWEAIKEAKRRGCHTYDFWGYSDPQKYPKHPYSGPTLFKMGFGGYKQEYVKTQDFVISPKYWVNYIIETIRRIKRGL